MDVCASVDATYKITCANGVLLSNNSILLQLGAPEKNCREDRDCRLVFLSRAKSSVFIREQLIASSAAKARRA
ncbi:MAG: hypothetical protein PCALPYG88_7192 [uncultured Paraburkholderia sp.]|nr:MAG: hypothetical protein PCALPYG88_7192 [uncultured Paraburkholderia sp.]